MRSFREISFRLRQEAANLWLLAANPHPPNPAAVKVEHLPEPSALRAALRGSALESEILRLAGQILERRVPLLGFTLALPADTAWRKDYISGIESGTQYFRRVPYLDPKLAGDHKVIWELNRHQHLVVLAQAWMLTRDPRYTAELGRELTGWFETNPFMRGINWASALEVAFRAWSWIWILHLAGDGLDAELRQRLVTGLYQHGLYLEYNLSFYFSPNTHLMGEAAVLHLLGRLLPALPRSASWEEFGGKVTADQMDRQMRPDGSHFEQSSYYHVYAVDFFLLHLLYARSVPAGYRERLIRSIEFLDALLGPQRRIPLLGDDDGGRLFHPFGDRDRFGRATLATGAALFNRPEWLADRADLMEQAVWWMGPRVLEGASPGPRTPDHRRIFEQTGLLSITSGDLHVLFDVGPFGSGTAGHSHSDTLSVVVRKGREDLLIDPGTYTYVGDPKWREWFRGSGAHNTIRVDEQDQATGSGPFRWLDPPQVEVLESKLQGGELFADARCRYREVVHRRTLRFREPEVLCILDRIEGPAGEHTVEQLWHAGEACVPAGTGFRIGSSALLTLSAPAGLTSGWRSRALGQKEESPLITGRLKTALPVALAAVLDLRSLPDAPAEIRCETRPDGNISVIYERDGGSFTFVF